ncbi:opacity protein [Sphingosinicella terrae]|uniref:opacity protein n=1 Tax=Sphingosinicella terrae TaxID=2172047 RepID=UPI000E0CE55F|nr:opacity protein [Sphingosinicella terrae]
MKTHLFAAAVLAAGIPAAGSAQSTSSSDSGWNTTGAPAAAEPAPAAPDGTPAFGIEPYVGVLGGYHSFDRDSEFGTVPGRGRMGGWLVSGIAGVNVPLGPVFVGAEGNATKGFDDISWEYGVRGRAGVRAGDSGMVFASAGHQWVNGRRGFSDQKDWIYGIGVEVGPSDIGLGGITGNSGVRIRLQAETYDFDSLRPMAGLVFHF